MYVCPTLLPVTTPLLLTEAILLSSLLQVTLLLEALLGDTVAVSCMFLPTSTLALEGLTDTPVTLTTASLTVMVDCALKPLSFVFTVMVALPFFFPVTRPVLDTEATLLSLESHDTPLLVALAGLTVAVS